MSPCRHWGVTRPVEREHWLSAVVGVIDAAWNLTAEEQHHVNRIISVILDELDIPDRGDPVEIPVPIAMEVEGGFYSCQIHDAALSSEDRPVREVTEDDLTASPDVWRSSLVGLFTTAYPDLSGVERVWLSATIGELLGGIGVATRAPVWLSEDVVRVAANP